MKSLLSLAFAALAGAGWYGYETFLAPPVVRVVEARRGAAAEVVYATGAEIQFADREVIEQIVAAVRKKDYGFRSLIHEVVQARVFLNK